MTIGSIELLEEDPCDGISNCILCLGCFGAVGGGDFCSICFCCSKVDFIDCTFLGLSCSEPCHIGCNYKNKM